MFFRRVKRLFSLAACLAIVVCVAGLASEASEKKPPDYALIFGTIWSADGRPVAGATIKIRKEDDKKPKWTLTSDSRGEFAQRVPVGKADYIVWAELPKTKEHLAETTVHILNDERVDIGLHLAK